MIEGPTSVFTASNRLPISTQRIFLIAYQELTSLSFPTTEVLLQLNSLNQKIDPDALISSAEEISLT